MAYDVARWTNPSVQTLARGRDPIFAIQNKAKQMVLEAVEKGWDGPPYDPFRLAELNDIRVYPNDDVLDARLVPDDLDGFLIEFNPHRPPARIRFSVAHEIAHTLFPDCSDAIRNRIDIGSTRGDEWQLELLCNIGAAEVLMPLAYSDLRNEDVGIDNLLRLRRQYDVSTEAILIRIAKLTSRSCAIFSSARVDDSNESSGHRIDYSVPSRSWDLALPREIGAQINTVLDECTAIGFTAKGTEHWSDTLSDVDVECVGIPPYPGSRFPRVAGVVTHACETLDDALQIEFRFGDAREPRGAGKRIVAHIVNDQTPNWGGGFAREVRRLWPRVQDDFREWAGPRNQNLVLGNVHVSQVNEELSLVQMVAQHGFGPSRRPRLRYAALRDALDLLERIASEQGASVHMPRIGSGHAGGNWELIRELIDERLVRREVPVYVYTLPDEAPNQVQSMLAL